MMGSMAEFSWRIDCEIERIKRKASIVISKQGRLAKNCESLSNQQRQRMKQSVGARVHRETTHQLWHTGLIPSTNWTRDYPTKKPTVFPLISFDKAYSLSLCARHAYSWATDAKKLIKKPHLDIMPDCWNILNPNIIFIDVPSRQPPACVDFFLFQNSLQLVKKIWRISW